MKGTNLGEFEELVLLTIAALMSDAYSVAICDELEKHTGRSLLALALFWVALSTLMILRALSCWPLKYRIGAAVCLFPALAILNWLLVVIISITVDHL